MRFVRKNEKKRDFTLKNLKETLVNDTHDREQMDAFRNAIEVLSQLGYISKELNREFFEQCSGWYHTMDFCEEVSEIRDYRHGDQLIWSADQEEYIAE